MHNAHAYTVNYLPVIEDNSLENRYQLSKVILDPLLTWKSDWLGLFYIVQKDDQLGLSLLSVDEEQVWFCTFRSNKENARFGLVPIVSITE